MANTTNTASEKKVKITLPLLPGDAHTSQDVFVAVNFKPYIIRRGEEVEIPESVYDALMQSEKAKNDDIRARQRLALRTPENSK